MANSQKLKDSHDMEPSQSTPNKPAGSRRFVFFRPQRLVENVVISPDSIVSPTDSVIETVLLDLNSFDPASEADIFEEYSPSELILPLSSLSTLPHLPNLSRLDEALAMMDSLVSQSALNIGNSSGFPNSDAPEVSAIAASVSTDAATDPKQTKPINNIIDLAPKAQDSVAPVLKPVTLVTVDEVPEQSKQSRREGPTSPFDPSAGSPSKVSPISTISPISPIVSGRMGFAAMDERLDKELDEDTVPSGKNPEPFSQAISVKLTTADKTEKSVSDLRIQQAVAAAKKVKGQLDMEKFGLHNEAQWLLFSPHRYDDYKNITKEFSTLMAGNVAVVKGTIVSKKLFDASRNETTNIRSAVRMLAVIKDVTGKTIPVNAFGKPGFAWKVYEKGSDVIIRVKPQRAFSGYGLELNNPEIVKKSLLDQIVPIYPPLRVTKGDKFAVEVNRNLGLLDMAAEIVEDDSGWHDRHAPVQMKELTKFDSAHDMLRALHRPTSVRQGDDAMLAAKRLSSYTLVRKTAERSKAIKVNPKSMINIDLAEIESLKKRLPYKLTGDQDSVIDGIVKSLRGPKPMDGLLSGDVGTGKTAAFLIPMVAAHKAGKRVMLLTPNLLLIAQVARELRTYFPEMNVCTVNGKGGIQGDHESSIIIGSTALINAMKKGKIGKKPDFLVVDEQHKFSVEQRDALKDTHTNKIEATATPIPRTAAMATHGAHDLFLLRDVPVIKSIRTEVLGLENGKQAGQAIIDALRRGEQACVIYPLVNATLDENGEPTKNAKKAVNGAAEHWKSFVAIEDIAVLHGKMKDDEKEAVLNDFRAGNKKLLLASIVIEVGVTLPELKTMLVTDADRFGVVTLHQLRGRLARHGGEGHFVLYSENTEDPDVFERLNLVKDNIDGFDLAEKDAEVRGFGDLLGIDGDNQSGATRALFQGVKIGPKDISFAAHLHEKAISIADSDEDNQQVKKSHGMRPA